jgi:predicted alpha/beta hydrolase
MFAEDTITTADGTQIGVRWYGTPSKALDVIVCGNATGIDQRFYERFAQAATAGGRAVLTFDYRTVGRSLVGELKSASGRLRDWGRYDLDAALRHASQVSGHEQLLYVGHSIGAQLLGLAPEAGRVRRALCFAGGNPYFEYYEGDVRAWLHDYWSRLVPSEVKAEGYFPGSKHQLNADLAGSIALDLARWCLHPEYMVDDDDRPLSPEFGRVHARIKFLVGKDDFLSPQKGVEKMIEFYTHSQCELTMLDAKDCGVKRIGHLGYFRADVLGPYWEQWLAWLTERAPA